MRHAVARRTVIALACAGACLLAVPACAAKASRTPFTSRNKDLQISPQELRIRVRALIRPTLGILEQAADRALSESPSPETRRFILVWKIETTTTLLSTLLHQDPIYALGDSWAYVIQVKSFVEKEDVTRQYGAFAPVATAALSSVVAEMRSFVDGLQEVFTADTVEAKVRRWADLHPIEGALSRRPAIDSTIAGVLATANSGGALAALGSLEETTGELMMRMDLYTMYLPRLARWEAELAAGDLTRGVELDQLSAELTRFTRAADRIAGVAEQAPAVAERERAAALSGVRAERQAVVDALHDERVASLAEVEAIAQRVLDRQGVPFNAAVRSDLDELVNSVEAMRKRLLTDAETSLLDVVDHAFIKALELLFIAAGLGAIGLVLYARVLRR
jgi:hypothetical protein